MDYEKFGIPFKEGNRYFKNDGLQNQSVLYTLTTLTANLECYSTRNAVRGWTVAFLGLSISEDGKLCALPTAGQTGKSGKFGMWKMRRFTDHLKWIKFSLQLDRR